MPVTPNSSPGRSTILAWIVGAVVATLTVTTLSTTTLKITEQAEPALSAAGSATVYADSTSHTLKVSNNGGAYADVIKSGGALGTPSSGTLTNCTIPMSKVTGGTDKRVPVYDSTGLTVGIAPGTSGNVLTSNGTDWTSAAPSGGETFVYRASNSSNKNDNTFASDDTLLFNVSASKIYSLRMVLHVATDSTADFKYQFTGPASPTSMAYGSFHTSGAGASAFTASNVATSFSTAHSLSSCSNDNVIEINLILSNGVNSGTVTLQWAQNTTTGGTNTVVKAGSYLAYKQLN
jgi:hypothetical protein